MVYHLILCKLKPEVDVELMMIDTRRYLICHLQELLGVRCGKCIDPKNEWAFFVQIEANSLEKLKICMEDPCFVKYLEEVFKPRVAEQLVLDYEGEPQKDVQYS